jgi:hypothetical protein
MVLEAIWTQETRKPGEIFNTTDFTIKIIRRANVLELANF